MRTPSSKLRALRPRLHHPSPALAVAVVALFMSLGGVSYAAYALPANSVGNAQLTNDSVQTRNIKPYNVTTWRLANDSVNFRKIIPGSVGRVRIQKSTVQLRVDGTCTAANQAITSVNIEGGTTCGVTSPTEYDTGAPKQMTTLTGNMTTLASQSLVGGSAYLVQAQPNIEVTSGAHDVTPETVDVTCTLAAGPATTATITRTQTVALSAAGQAQSVNLPLTVVAPESTNSIVAPVSCSAKVTSGSGSPVVQAQATVFATTIQQPPAPTAAAH